MPRRQRMSSSEAASIAGQASAKAQQERLGEDGYSQRMSEKGKKGGRPTFEASTRGAWERLKQAERKGTRPGVNGRRNRQGRPAGEP